MVRGNMALCLLSLTLIYHRPAAADFRVSGPATQNAVSDEPHVSPGDPGQYPVKPMARRNRYSTNRILAHRGTLRNLAQAAAVQGFGAGVPLAFACLQIVPRSLKIVYGPSVDPQTPVNWTGGRSWAAVLRDALRPAGLMLVPHGDLVEITN